MRHGISIWIDVPLDMVAKEIVEESFQPPAAETIQGSYPEVYFCLSDDFHPKKLDKPEYFAHIPC